MKLVLGSASRWRKILLEQAGYHFSVMSADIDEKAIRHPDPKQLVLAIANAKADVLLRTVAPDNVLITADQVVMCHDEIFEKPASKQQARHFLQTYNKYSAYTITGLVVSHQGKRVSGVDVAKVNFNIIDEDAIEALIDNEEIYHCAGGFQIEKGDELNPYVASYEGDLDSIKGLPIKLLEKLLMDIREI